MYKKLIADIICALLILLFAYTAMSKIRDMHRFITVLRLSPILQDHAVLTGWALPLIELLIVCLLFFVKTRIPGLFLALLLLSLFSAYIIYMLLFVRDLPCPCGGVLSWLNWKQHLFFNGCWILITVAGIVLLKTISSGPINRE